MKKNLRSSWGLWHRVTRLVRTIASQDPTASIFTIYRSYQETEQVQSVERTGYRLNDPGFQFRHGSQICSLLQISQTGSGAYPASNWYRGSYAWVRRTGHEVGNSPSYNAKVNNEQSYNSRPLVYLPCMDQEYLTFYFTSTYQTTDRSQKTCITWTIWAPL
jgi:hypothetical protein